jgi:hypothetical protein
MLVININDKKNIYLNADLTISEVENDDNVLIEGDFNTISIYPRVYMDEVTISIYDEITDETVVEDVFTSFGERGRQDIYVDFDFEDDKSYLIDFKQVDTEILIFRGRLFSTSETNIQEFNRFDEDTESGIIEA